MRALGGYASLGQLYETAPHIAGSEWKTRTPFASIRRIVQDAPTFFRIRPGLWGLTERQDEITAQFAPEEKATPQATEKTHAYYQGLLVQLGNWQNLQTVVPAQDKNKAFGLGKLADVATLTQCYPFTYDTIVSKARTVDVIWFNTRNLPHTFFEVEHSTDIYNSLRKFGEFQDFRARLYIVADPLRQAEYNDKIAATAYAEIRPLVEFYPYDKLITLHAHQAQLAALGAAL